MIIIPAQNRSEIETCADIWLQASLAAHDFVSPDFWREHHTAMKEQYLPNSDVYLAKEEDTIVGFAAVHQGALEALFVSPACWGKGVGSRLLRHVQDLHAELTLAVYSKNSRAVGFYLHHGFTVSKEQICPHTSEPELLMLWKKRKIDRPPINTPHFTHYVGKHVSSRGKRTNFKNPFLRAPSNCANGVA